MSSSIDYAQRFAITLADGSNIEVVVSVDTVAIAERLAARANRSKGRSATALHGAVKVKVVK